jgi:hypothetical protein
LKQTAIVILLKKKRHKKRYIRREGKGIKERRKKVRKKEIKGIIDIHDSVSPELVV